MSAFEQAFLTALREWLKCDWRFDRSVFGSRRNMIERRRRYEANGLREVARLVSKDGARVFHFHAT